MSPNPLLCLFEKTHIKNTLTHCTLTKKTSPTVKHSGGNIIMWYALLHHAAAEVLKISIYIYIYMKKLFRDFLGNF